MVYNFVAGTCLVPAPTSGRMNQKTEVQRVDVTPGCLCAPAAPGSVLDAEEARGQTQNSQPPTPTLRGPGAASPWWGGGLEEEVALEP
jgi:hypothetical protein